MWTVLLLAAAGMLAACGSQPEPGGAAAQRLYPVVQEGEWGYIDTSGTVQIEPAFDAAWPFVDNDRALIRQDGRYGYIDRTGAVVIAPQYADAWHFADGLAPVQSPGRPWTFIDPTGEPVAAPQFHLSPRLLVEDGSPPTLQRVWVAGQYGYRNSQGEMVIAPRFEQAWYFSGGRARVKLDGQWGFINHDGEVVIAPQFNRAWDFSGGIALVHTPEGYGYIDRSGAYVWPPTQ